jgi:hypothetical protein
MHARASKVKVRLAGFITYFVAAKCLQIIRLAGLGTNKKRMFEMFVSVICVDLVVSPVSLIFLVELLVLLFC